MSSPPLSWCDALEAEYLALHGVPAFDDGPLTDSPERLRQLHARIHQRAPSALCLSGGGIRSATFALGVMQGLAHLGVLGKFDYLSTVSGGGYTGGWFTTWLHRQGAEGRDEVLRSMDPAQPPRPSVAGASDDRSSPLERLRKTCRYLAPTGGVVSADVWTVGTTMARNLVLNWLVILPLLATALLVPRIFYAVTQIVEQGLVEGLTLAQCAPQGSPQAWFFLITLITSAMCTAYVVMNLVGRGGTWSQGRFLVFFLAPTVSGAVSLTLFFAAYPCPLKLSSAMVISAGIPLMGWALFGLVGSRYWGRSGRSDGSALHVRAGWRTILAAVAAGCLLGAGTYWLGTYPFGFGAGESLRELYTIFAVPIVLGIVLTQMTLFAGFASFELDDAVLEWWSRAGAWIAIAATLWMVAGVLVFIMADLVETGIQVASRAVAWEHQTSARVVFAALVPLLSSLAALLARSSSENSRPSGIVIAIQKVALPLVIWLLLSSIAWADLRGLEALEYHSPGAHPAGAGLGEILMLGAALLAFGLVMSRLVPVNRFSLHGMYRQRIIRTFLGSSRRDRRPNAFTGFDGTDDVCVHDLRNVRPLHIVNATLNAVSSTHIGRHEKQSQSFTFSPLHVGNHEVGYRPASEYGSDGGGRGTGLSLGMALAVSGAAASSAMGMFSSKARAFLFTLANARLGLWFGNPQSEKTWQNSEPPLGVGPLMREMLGLTTDNNPYVYLSDGGHYENLGLWEMVARRCRIIVISDAGCDPRYTFDDLANAVRRIRLDLGVPIQFPPLEQSREGQGRTNLHGAVGVIRYSAIDGPDAPDGTILYLKATLSGDEPVDVRNFASADPMFPHDTTANQFFDEARFESYRTLGFHTVLSVSAGFDHTTGVQGLCETAGKAIGIPTSPFHVGRPLVR